MTSRGRFPFVSVNFLLHVVGFLSSGMEKAWTGHGLVEHGLCVLCFLLHSWSVVSHFHFEYSFSLNQWPVCFIVKLLEVAESCVRCAVRGLHCYANVLILTSVHYHNSDQVNSNLEKRCKLRPTRYYLRLRWSSLL
jgi:hypothetical protein